MKIKRAWLVLLVWGMMGNASNGVATITADLSQHLIAITTAFAGTDVLLFGTVENPVGDVVVTVKGPDRSETVRMKERVGPIWLNLQEMTFDKVPFYYATASTGPLEDLTDSATRLRHGIGIDRLTLPIAAAHRDEAIDPATIEAFRQGLIRSKQKAGLYSRGPEPLYFVGSNLFRTTLHIPANVQPGSYGVEVLHLRDGIVRGAQRSTLSISKIGLEADIFDYSDKHAALYGIACIILAIAAGWTASLIFRRR